jgi:hypothetical protein
MRLRITGLLLGTVGLACGLLLLPPESGAKAARRGRPADAKGWLDLAPGAELRGWKRAPILPDTKLGSKNPWSMSEDGRTLRCDGAGVKEMLLYEREFKDGVFHVEWRFRKQEGAKDYNAGIYVRTLMNGTVWHQAQVAHLEKAPRMGDLFGETRVDGKPQKFLVEGRGRKLVQPPGEWNTFEIACKGPEVRVAINGETATNWHDCKISGGHVGLQAEYFFIEFRNLRFKPAD